MIEFDWCTLRFSAHKRYVFLRILALFSGKPLRFSAFFILFLWNLEFYSSTVAEEFARNEYESQWLDKLCRCCLHNYICFSAWYN